MAEDSQAAEMSTRPKRMLKPNEASNLIREWIETQQDIDSDSDIFDSDDSDQDPSYLNLDKNVLSSSSSSEDEVDLPLPKRSRNDFDDLGQPPSKTSKSSEQLELDLQEPSTSRSVDIDLDLPSPAPPTVTSQAIPPTTSARGKAKGKGKSTRGKGKGKIAARKPASGFTTEEYADFTENLDFESDDRWRRVPTQEYVETANNIRFSPPFVGPCDKVGDQSTALDCFLLLVDLQVRNRMMNNINEYGRQKKQQQTPLTEFSRLRKWEDITPAELFRFLIVLIIMSLNKKPEIEDYWSYSPEMYTPFMHKIMTGEQFLLIYSSMLHCGDARSEGKDKVEPFIDLLVKKFKESFYPWQKLSLDEMIIGFKGRWAFKQYNASKPKKYHIKNFGLCDSATGYVLNVLTYYGRNTSYCPAEDDEKSGQAKKVFEVLLKGLVKGHTIFADRYYTSRELVNYLLSKKFYFTGTLNVNRVGFPAQLKSAALATNENISFVNEDKSIMCTMFRDKKANKPVVLISTQSNNDTIPIKGVDRPTVVDDYNQHMNGCDRLDQMVNYYGVHNRRAKKWWRKLFLWILEVAQFNAYVLYVLSRAPPSANEKETKVSFRQYKKLLWMQMCEYVDIEVPSRKDIVTPVVGKRGCSARPTLMERKSGQHLPLYDERDHNCKHCSKPGKRSRTHFYCSGCAVKTYLHPKGCFYDYHTQK